jgi:hypothetical protein
LGFVNRDLLKNTNQATLFNAIPAAARGKALLSQEIIAESPLVGGGYVNGLQRWGYSPEGAVECVMPVEGS